MTADALAVFTLLGHHVFDRFFAAEPRPFTCEQCGGAWADLDAALKTPCGGRVNG